MINALLPRIACLAFKLAMLSACYSQNIPYLSKTTDRPLRSLNNSKHYVELRETITQRRYRRITLVAASITLATSASVIAGYRGNEITLSEAYSALGKSPSLNP